MMTLRSTHAGCHHQSSQSLVVRGVYSSSNNATRIKHGKVFTTIDCSKRGISTEFYALTILVRSINIVWPRTRAKVPWHYTICCPISSNSRVPLSRVSHKNKRGGGEKLFPTSQENGRVGRAIRVPHQTWRRTQREPCRSTRVYRPSSMALRPPRWTVMGWTRRRTSRVRWSRGTPWTVRRWTRRRAWCCPARRIAARGSLQRERSSCSWLRRSCRARPGMSCWWSGAMMRLRVQVIGCGEKGEGRRTD